MIKSSPNPGDLKKNTKSKDIESKITDTEPRDKCFLNVSDKLRFSFWCAHYKKDISNREILRPQIKPIFSENELFLSIWTFRGKLETKYWGTSKIKIKSSFLISLRINGSSCSSWSPFYNSSQKNDSHG